MQRGLLSNGQRLSLDEKGEMHAVKAQRAQHLNITGVWRLLGKLVMAKLWQSVNGLWIFGFLDLGGKS